MENSRRFVGSEVAGGKEINANVEQLRSLMG